MKKFVSTCAPLNMNNVDTDQIIPARFLKGTSKTGLGENLFNDWRYNDDGSPNPDFILNKEAYKGAEILVAPHNFGCGSSREHAPWALKDYGFKAVVAISFADIFKNNSLKNGLLPIALPEDIVMLLLQDLDMNSELQVEIDLENQTVRVPRQPQQGFSIDPFRKHCLMEGVDDIGYTLGHLDKIKTFEATLS